MRSARHRTARRANPAERFQDVPGRSRRRHSGIEAYTALQIRKQSISLARAIFGPVTDTLGGYSMSGRIVLKTRFQVKAASVSRGPWVSKSANTGRLERSRCGGGRL